MIEDIRKMMHKYIHLFEVSQELGKLEIEKCGEKQKDTEAAEAIAYDVMKELDKIIEDENYKQNRREK